MNTDYDDVLRRALHAAAESVEPTGDGLERIRARIGPPQLLSFGSVAAWYSDAALRVSTWAQPAVAALLDAFWSVIDRFRPATARPGHARPRFAWLRPVAAMGTAIFVIGAGAFAVMTLPQAISQSGAFSSSGSTHAGSGHHGGGSGVNGGGTPLPTGAASPGLSGSPSASSSAASKCSSLGKSRTGGTSPSASSSASTSPTTPTSSPPTTTSPPVTTSPTGPSSPTTSGSASPDPGSAGTSPPASTSGTGTSTSTSTTAKQRRQAHGMLPSLTSSPVPCPSSSAKKHKKSAVGAQVLKADSLAMGDPQDG